MKVLRNVLLLLSFLALQGCVVTSLNPIYTEKDVVYLPQLEGTWSGDESNTDYVQFLPAADSDNEYTILFSSKEARVALSGHLASLDEKIYLDLTIKEVDDATEEKCPELAFTRPIHFFYMIEVEGDTFRMRGMSSSWVKQRREKHLLRISHNPEGDSTLLTADTARVQRFLKRWDNNKDAWDGWQELKRIPHPA